MDASVAFRRAGALRRTGRFHAYTQAADRHITASVQSQRVDQLTAPDAGEPCAARSCSSTSGPTPASTGFAPCPTSAPGPQKYKDQGPGSRRRAPHRVRSRRTSPNVRRAAQMLRVDFPDRGRQRARRSGNAYRQPVLARDLSHRRRRPHSASPVRRGKLATRQKRPIQELLAGSGQHACRAQHWLSVNSPGRGSRGGLGHAEIAGELSRLSAHRRVFIAGPRGHRQAAYLHCSYTPFAHRLGVLGQLDDARAMPLSFNRPTDAIVFIAFGGAT